MNIFRELSPDFVEFMLDTTYQLVNRYCQIELRASFVRNYHLPEHFLAESRPPIEGIIDLNLFKRDTRPTISLRTSSGSALMDEAAIQAIENGLTNVSSRLDDRMPNQLPCSISFHQDDLQITSSWDAEMQRFLRLHLLAPLRECLMEHPLITQSRKHKTKQTLTAALSIHRTEGIKHLVLLEGYGDRAIDAIYLDQLRKLGLGLPLADDLPLQIDALICTDFPKLESKLNQRMHSISVEDELISNAVNSQVFPKGPKSRLYYQRTLEQINEAQARTAEYVNAQQYLELCKLYTNISDYEGAERACQKALELQPKSEYAVRMMLRVLMERLKLLPRDHRDFLLPLVDQHCVELASLADNNAGDLPNVYMALALAEAGHGEKSRSYFTNIKDWKQMHFKYASALEHGMCLEEALKEFRLCLGHLPTDFEKQSCIDQILRLLNRLGRHREAVKEDRLLRE